MKRQLQTCKQQIKQGDYTAAKAGLEDSILQCQQGKCQFAAAWCVDVVQVAKVLLLQGQAKQRLQCSQSSYSTLYLLKPCLGTATLSLLSVMTS